MYKQAPLKAVAYIFKRMLAKEITGVPFYGYLFFSVLEAPAVDFSACLAATF